MELTFSPETKKLLEDRLKSGQYQSTDELVRAALEALDDRDSFERSLEFAVNESEAQFQQGDFHEWKDVREQVKKAFLGK